MSEARFQCPECSATFAREGNLHRHTRIHSPDQHFFCDICLDSFSRADALARHISARHPGLERTRSQASRHTRITQACRPCSQSKLRCDGGRPSCQRCSRQQQRCSYPPQQRRQMQASESPQEPTSIHPFESFPTPSPVGNGSTHVLLGDETDFSNLELFGFDGVMVNDCGWPADFSFLQQLSDSVVDPVPMQSPAAAQLPSPESLIVSGDERCLSPKPSAVDLEHRRYMPRSACIGLSFPDFSHVSPQDIAREDSAQVPEVQASDLSIISGFAEKLQNAAFYPPFQALRIPPPAVMNVFVQLYFEHFHPIFPMLHQPSFGKGAPRPLLTLAVATIGARYSKLEGASQCALAMTELLRRLTMHLCETDNRFSRQISLLQCIVLHHLSGLHSGDRRLMEVVEINQCIPAALGRRTGLFRSGSSLSPDAVRAIPLEDRWHLWIKEEENRRTSHAMSVLDHHIRLHAQITSVISKEELRIELPSHEDLWAAPSALAWSNTFQGPYPPPTPSLHHLETHPDPSSLWPRLGHLAKLSAILNLSHAHHTLDSSTTILDFIPTLELPADASAPAPHRRRAVDALLAFHWGKLALHCPVRDVMACVFGAIAEHHGSGGGEYGGCGGHGGYGSRAEEKGDEGDHGEHSACSLLTSNRRRARACVRHAAQAYGLLRKYRSAACSAPAVLLNAVAVLWLYARLEETGGGSDGCRGGGAADEAVVYLDELDGMGGDAATALDFWVECGIGQPRLAGVGVLRTAAGRRRLLAEAEGLCEAMGAWPTCWLYRRIFRRLGGVEGEAVM